MNSKDSAFDDFTVISGIGPSRQMWLREAFDIHTYQDLGELSASQIEEGLKVKGKIVSRKAIESWIEQAKALIPNSAVSRQVGERKAAKELVEKYNSSFYQNGWEPFASFLVYFQTRKDNRDQSAYRTQVHYMEEDRETSWPGIDVKRLSAWMVGQISEFIDQRDIEGFDDVEQPQTTPADYESQAVISIDQIRIFQPVTADMPAHHLKAGKTRGVKLESERPFRLVVDFGLAGGDAGELAVQGISCLGRCYEYNSQSKSSSLLSESLPVDLETGKFEYTFEIPQASLPRGDYRLWVVVTTMQTGQLAPDFLELPMLKVS